MITFPSCLAFLSSLGAPELIVIGIIALLIFGRRLPEVGRSLGKSFVEFKKGLKDTSDEIKDIRSEAHKTLSNDSSEADSPAPFNAPKREETNAGSVH